MSKSKKLVGFCQKCKKETRHKIKSGFEPQKTGRNKGQYEFDGWFECVECGKRVSDEAADETFRYI